MAAKKVARKVTVEIPAEDNGEAPEDKTVSEREVDEALDRAENEVPTKVESRIFRRHPLTGNREMFTDTVDSDVVTADFLRQTYGGGVYRVQVIGPVKGKAGKPGRGVLKILRFEIDLSIPPKHPAQATTPASAMPNAPAQSQTSSIDVALATMIMGMVKQMSEGTTALQTMQMQMMKDHSNMLAAQLAHLAPKPERDPLEVLKEAASIIRPNETRGFGDFIKDYQAFKELIGDSEKEGTSWLDVIKEVAPTLVDAAARRDGVRSGRAAGRATAVPSVSGATTEPTGGSAAVLPAGTSPAGSVGTVASPNVSENLRFVAPIMPRVIKWAQQGKDATLCAEWLLSDIPAGFFPMLRQQLSSPTFLADVTAAFPQAGPFQPWIDALRNELVAQTAPEEEGEGETEEDEPE